MCSGGPAGVLTDRCFGDLLSALQLVGSLLNIGNQTYGNNITLFEVLLYLSCQLREMQLQNNLISGSIPPSITILAALHSLNMGYNRLTGP